MYFHFFPGAGGGGGLFFLVILYYGPHLYSWMHMSLHYTHPLPHFLFPINLNSHSFENLHLFGTYHHLVPCSLPYHIIPFPLQPPFISHAHHQFSFNHSFVSVSLSQINPFFHCHSSSSHAIPFFFHLPMKKH